MDMGYNPIHYCISLLCQGYFIMTGKHGYIHHEREKQKMYNARKQSENKLENKGT